jgi:hypothetical protein
MCRKSFFWNDPAQTLSRRRFVLGAPAHSELTDGRTYSSRSRLSSVEFRVNPKILLTETAAADNE